MKNFLSSRSGIIIVGLMIGIIASLLQKLGNPANMGICVACFERDIAGALGLHRASVVQYLRPEIIGILLGATIISLIKGEFKPQGGSSTIIRFVLGFFAMIGALVFLGCPWRAFLRLAGGDLNAVLGIAGLITGIFAGTLFLRKGYNLGRSQPARSKINGWILPVIMIIFLFLLLAHFKPVFSSTTGPGSQRAPILISLIAGLVIGILAQRSRFCTMGSLRDIFIVKDFHLFSGVAAFAVSAFIMNLIFGQFRIGFQGQPVAHTQHLWNFLGMVLAGLAFSLAGGCPGRQLILSGEGDSDAGIFVIGMISGAAFAHNFSLASSPAGIGNYGAYITIAGLVFCTLIGFSMIEKRITRSQ
ncbi:MAG: YedE-related selenium metabolism membrane protein [Candidatus Cloacimonetes bacterium]|nr:YedE-related selenium metabolism membrane protein [Candidatus Cloacimonadota bacterium]